MVEIDFFYKFINSRFYTYSAEFDNCFYLETLFDLHANHKKFSSKIYYWVFRFGIYTSITAQSCVTNIVYNIYLSKYVLRIIRSVRIYGFKWDNYHVAFRRFFRCTRLSRN